MAVSEKKLREYSVRVMLSRMRVLCSNGFYGLLLMHMKVSVTESCKNACADSRRICFHPDFLDKISDPELDYVMMHLISHVVLRHASRRGDRRPEEYWKACDTVVNSNILYANGGNEMSITLDNAGGVQPHLAPNGKEGHEFSVEELYEMLLLSGVPMTGENGKGHSSRKGSTGGKNSVSTHDAWDDHELMEAQEEDESASDAWMKYFRDACEAVSRRCGEKGRGFLPAFAERMLNELHKAQTDWRSILNDFVQEEIADYSFAPPDRRFPDSPFFLPDFNEKEDSVADILFMIDTSGSMSDEEITAAFSEVAGAIEQFNGKIRGWLGFFDAAVYEPKPFDSVEDVKSIRPLGGGGTDFDVIFDYVFAQMQDSLPVSIIILTDGGAPFPDEKEAQGIPVLWLLNNETSTPPWGKVARIKV